MDDGRLTDAKGRKVDFRNTILIMTSNVGAELIRRESVLGFNTPRDLLQDQKAAYERMKDKVLTRSEEHTSELQSQSNLVCRLLLEKKKLQPGRDAALLQPRPEIGRAHV